jgi:H/ACA ribonucleoprotein complex subunit 2
LLFRIQLVPLYAKRPTSCMLGLPDAVKGGDKMSDEDAKEFKEMYGKVVAKIKSLD